MTPKPFRNKSLTQSCNFSTQSSVYQYILRQGTRSPVKHRSCVRSKCELYVQHPYLAYNMVSYLLGDRHSIECEISYSPPCETNLFTLGSAPAVSDILRSRSAAVWGPTDSSPSPDVPDSQGRIAQPEPDCEDELQLRLPTAVTRSRKASDPSTECRAEDGVAVVATLAMEGDIRHRMALGKS